MTSTKQKQTTATAKILNKRDVQLMEKLAKSSSTKELYAFQNDANKTVRKGVKQYQTVLCAAILHVATHRNTNVIKHVIENMEEGLRKKSAIAFFNEYSNCTVDVGDKGEINVTLVKGKGVQLGVAMESPWQKMGGEEIKPFDLLASLKQLVNRANNRLKKGEEGDNIDPEVLAILAGTVNRFDQPVSEAAAA